MELMLHKNTKTMQKYVHTIWSEFEKYLLIIIKI